MSDKATVEAQSLEMKNPEPETTQEEQRQEDKAAVDEELLELLGEHELELAVVSDDAAPRPVLPSFQTMTSEQLEKRFRRLKRDEGRKRPEELVEQKRELLDGLRMHEERLKTLCAFVEKVQDKEPTEVRRAALEESQRLQKVFATGMTTTLAAQRTLERGIRSLHVFFLESLCDGRANSVCIINHNPSEASKAPEESAIPSLEAVEQLGGHPLWESSVDEKGQPYPITFQTLDTLDVFQRHTGAFAVGADIEGPVEMDYWANHAAKADSVAFLNVWKEAFLIDDANGGIYGWNDDVKVRLRGEFTSARSEFQNAVAVANHPVGRRASTYEDALGDVLVFPGFALLGKVYYNEKAAGDRCMVDAPIDPERDRIKWATEGVVCPWILNRRIDTNELNIVFVKFTDNRVGDDVYTVFNGSRTAFSQSIVPFETILGRNWLKRLVSHHLLAYQGARNTQEEAERIGKLLSRKLGNMSNQSDRAYFNRAYVEKATCKTNADTGRAYFEFVLHVEFREGVTDFVVQVGDGAGGGDADADDVSD